MKKLESEFKVFRYDIKTKERKIIKKYSQIIEKHEKFDLRLSEINSNELIKLNNYTLNKLLNLLSDTIPEEHILFLYEPSKIENVNNISSQKNTSSSFLDYSGVLNTTENSLDIFESEISLNKKLGKIGDTIQNINIIKNIKNVSIRKYYSILCITFLLYGSLIFLHLLRFFSSKEVS